MEEFKITVEFSVVEILVLKRAIQHYNPPTSDEMICIMLYKRIESKLKEQLNKNASS